MFGELGTAPANNNQQKGYAMKGYIIGLLKSRITRWSMLPVVLVGAALSVAWEGHHYRLGGAFIGWGGIIRNGYQAPLDPEGKTAAIRVNTITYGAGFAGLMKAFGADTLTEAVGESVMTSRDTYKFSQVSYLTKAGNPPTIQAIVVMWGTGKFTGPDTITIDYTFDVYPAAADANGDGLPDAGTKPVVSIPGTSPSQRVPLP